LAGAVVLGVAAVLGAAAADADLWVALVLGGVAEAAVAAGGFALLLRRSAWRARLAGGMAAALVAASAVAVGVPLRDAPATPKPVAGQEFWHLPSGSVLRYVHV